MVAQSDSMLSESNLSNQGRDAVSSVAVTLYTLVMEAYIPLARAGAYPGMLHLSEFIQSALGGVALTPIARAYMRDVGRIRDIVLTIADGVLKRRIESAWRAMVEDAVAEDAL